MTKIIVGVDGSEGAATALRWAVDEATIRGVDCVAVLAWGYLDQYPRGSFDPKYGDADALAALDAMVTAALESEVAGRVERRTVCDLPASALLDIAEDGDVLAVGARGLGGFRGLLLGSVSQHCLHHAKVPTVVVRGGRPEAVGKVVVGIDGSPQAEAALLWAVDEARHRRASLTVVHAYPPVVSVGPFSAMTIDQSLLEEAAERVVDAAISSIDKATVDITRRVVCASAASALVDAGDDADLVVVGSRGLSATRRLLLGSVATQVVHHASVSVAVVPS